MVFNYGLLLQTGEEYRLGTYMLTIFYHIFRWFVVSTHHIRNYFR